MPSLAKLDAIIAAETGGAEADSASETPAGAPPTGDVSGVESAPEAESSPTNAPADATTSGAPITSEAAARKALFDEKLAEARERRAAQRLQKQAREAKAQAEADRQAAAKERSAWEGVRGNWKEGLSKLGVDPGTALKEMVKQATEDGTPEAQITKMAAEFQARIDAIEADRKAEREALEAERREAAISQARGRFQADFRTLIAEPEFQPLRVEYEDQQIFSFANLLRQDRTQMVNLAKEFAIPLRDPAKGFTMKEILSVLKGQQARHEAGKQARAQKLAGISSQAPSQAPSESQTVNGTADRRNAGASTLGNELASTRATDAKPRTTRAERVRQLIEKG